MTGASPSKYWGAFAPSPPPPQFLRHCISMCMQFGVHKVIVDCVESYILAVAVIVGLLVAFTTNTSTSSCFREDGGI